MPARTSGKRPHLFLPSRTVAYVSASCSQPSHIPICRHLTERPVNGFLDSYARSHERQTASFVSSIADRGLRVRVLQSTQSHSDLQASNREACERFFGFVCPLARAANGLICFFHRGPWLTCPRLAVNPVTFRSAGI